MENEGMNKKTLIAHLKRHKWLVLVSAFFCFAASLIWVYYFETYALQVKYLEFSAESASLKKPMKIAVVSDLHWQKGQEWYAQKLVNKVNALNPDLIVLLGDYCYGHTHGKTMSAEDASHFFKELKAKYGVIGIQGNHDVVYGWGAWKKSMEDAGVKVLTNGSILVGDTIGSLVQVSGILDANTHRVPKSSIPLRLSPDIPHLLLSHTPDIFTVVQTGRVDLILSGHTHGGQICWPNGKAIKNGSVYNIFYNYPFDEREGKKLLISKGVGCSILPIRLFCRPEVLLLSLQ